MGSLLLVLVAVSLLEMAPLSKAASSPRSDDHAGFQQKVQSELDDLAAKVRMLDTKARHAGAKDRKQIDRDLNKAKADLRAAQAKLKRLEGASSDTWDGLRNELDRAEERAKASYERLAAKLR